MKHKVSKLFAILMMALALPQVAGAYTFSYTYQGQTLYYEKWGSIVRVTYQNTSYPRYTNLTGNLIIPDSVTYNGTTYPVTAIGEEAFAGCSGLTTLNTYW